MLFPELISLCLEQKYEAAAKVYVKYRCPLKSCAHDGNIDYCTGCLNKYLIYCSLSSCNPDLHKAAEGCKEWLDEHQPS